MLGLSGSAAQARYNSKLLWRLDLFAAIEAMSSCLQRPLEAPAARALCRHDSHVILSSTYGVGYQSSLADSFVDPAL